MLAFLKTILIERDEADKLLGMIDEERAKDSTTQDMVKRSIEQALDRCTRDLSNLTQLRYRDLIGDEEFVRQRSGLVEEQLKLKQRLDQLGTERWIEPARKLFLFSNRVVFWLAHGTITEKRLILSTVGSNFMLKAKKLNIDAKKPFVAVQQRHSFSNWSALLNDVRTLFTEEPDFVIPALPEPKTTPAMHA